MPTTERTADLASRRGLRILRSLGEELHQARLERCLSQSVVGRAAGVAQATVSRFEVVAGTRSNRRVLREDSEALRDLFPASTEEVLKDLAAGRSPSRNGMVLL